MPHYLGVDGGGTKTAFVLISDAGERVATVLGPSSYHLEYGFESVRATLADGVAELLARAGMGVGQLDFAFFALPGYGESSAATARLDALPGEVLGHDRYRCDNDMVAGWAGSLAGADGINVIAGTGSMTYGERQGRGARVGGWGELFGDEGSAHWIGIEALRAFTRMSDGRAARTALYERMRAHLGIDADLDAIGVVFDEWQRSRGRVAALATVVTELADAGDPVALDIIAQAIEELALLVAATREELGFEPGEAVPVSYSGGLFRAERVRAGFLEALGRRSADFAPRTPRFSSDVGAALQAAKLAGHPLSADALGRLASEGPLVRSAGGSAES